MAYELPPGYKVDALGYLRGPNHQTIASRHLGDGIWWSGAGSMGTGIDVHPVRRRQHPDHPFGSYACYADNCACKGFGIRRSAYISSLSIDFLISERLRRKCWELVESGLMPAYDEAHISRLTADLIQGEIVRLEQQLARVR